MMVTESVLPLISQILGWAYTLTWSVSFYPQPILNYRRKSTAGTTIDYHLLNIFGFCSYLIYNSIFYFSHQIRTEYARRNNGLMPTVQFNDVAYSVHAFIMCLTTFSQHILSSLWGFKERRKSLGARPSMAIWTILVCCLIYILTITIMVAIKNDDDPKYGWAPIDVVYAISYMKLVTTFFKYIPQITINYRNNSTEGWAMSQILLDVTGGVFSILQLGTDSYCQRDWSGITGNPAKLLLGNISIFFDIIIMTQHYCLYGQEIQSEVEEREPLLTEREDV